MAEKWSDFERNTIKDWIETVEGGYVNNPKDPGGETKFGISKRAYPSLDIKSLTLDTAIQLYYNNYWQPLMLGAYKFPTSFVLFDCAILCGPGWTNKTLRSSIDSLGAFFKNEDMIIDLITAKRLYYHAQDPNFGVFGKGWINRVARLLEKYISLKKIYS